MSRSIIKVSSDVLQWAIDESQLDLSFLTKKFPKLPLWLADKEEPTFKQLEDLSEKLKVPFGYLLLKSPPKTDLIISEFRTIGNNLISSPSKNLKDTLVSMQGICHWMRNYRIAEGEPPLAYVGSVSGSENSSERMANVLREVLGLTPYEVISASDYAAAFKTLRTAAESKGVLVFISGMVGSNTHRSLDIREFRAFSIVDKYAPVVFINGTDTETGRVFSLLHELFHVLLGVSGVTNRKTDEEGLCNQAAIDFLAPTKALIEKWAEASSIPLERISSLSRFFKASELAIAIKLKSLGRVDDDFVSAVRMRMEENLTKKRGGGGDFWNNKLFAISPTFGRAVVQNTTRGLTSYTDACRLLSISKMKTFDDYAKKVCP